MMDGWLNAAVNQLRRASAILSGQIFMNTPKAEQSVLLAVAARLHRLAWQQPLLHHARGA